MTRTRNFRNTSKKVILDGASNILFWLHFIVIVFFLVFDDNIERKLLLIILHHGNYLASFSERRHLKIPVTFIMFSSTKLFGSRRLLLDVENWFYLWLWQGQPHLKWERSGWWLKTGILFYSFFRRKEKIKPERTEQLRATMAVW